MFKNKSKHGNKKISHANRGMAFEKAIEIQNEEYMLKKYGFVQKIATPTFRKKSGDIYREKSTVDFIGALKGIPVAFDVKECNQKRFNFKTMIKDHQVDCLLKFQNGGSMSFFLINFALFNEVYLIMLDNYLMAKKSNLKSFSLNNISIYGWLVCDGYMKNIDYLKVLEKIK